MKARRKTQDGELLVESSRTKRASGELELQEWLDISWFYPEGFTREQLVESDNALVVLGKTLVYKFIKCPAKRGAENSFLKRWQLSCREIVRNRETSPDLYLGLRLLRWVDGQPMWFTELCSGELLADKPPESADEVAIVMRRIPGRNRLLNVLDDDRGLSVNQLADIARLLTSFHLRRRAKGIKSFSVTPESLLDSYRVQTLGPMRVLEQHFGGARPECVMLRELKNYFNRKYLEFAALFSSRAEQGMVIDLHGNLSVSSICLGPIEVEGQRISFVSRPTCEEQLLLGDVLIDLSRIVVDLELRGQSEYALRLEDEYFSLNEQAYDRDIYNFSLVSAALQLAVSRLAEFESGKYESTPPASRYLAFALRVALNLRQPFILAVGGSSEASRSELVSQLSEISGASALRIDSVATELPGYSPPDDLQFLRLMTICRRKLASGRSVIVDWPFNRLEERLKIVHIARRFSLPYMLVKLKLSAKEKESRAYSVVPQEQVSSVGLASRRLWSSASDSWSDSFAHAQGVRYEVVDSEQCKESLPMNLLKKLGKKDW